MWKTVLLLIVSAEMCSVQSDSCPALYKRFNGEHTFCKSKNPKCKIEKSGITKDEKEHIVKFHNAIRNNIATGKDKSGRMPPASDMLEMQWDDELSQIAQKHTELCISRHDCKTCRQVENFEVGQNLYKHTVAATKPPGSDWLHVLRTWYGEIYRFNPDTVTPYITDHATEQFTQVVWSSTWRVGCGYVAYRETHGKYVQLYVCNYGPAGNIKDGEMYKIGKQCSKCPGNTCCGKNCRKGSTGNYNGLCKVLNDKGPDVGDNDFSNFIFHCDFRTESTSDCRTQVEGAKKWETRQILSGAYKTAVLNGGESTVLKFTTPIQSDDGFCFIISFRKGPNVAGQKDNSRFSVEFSEKTPKTPISLELDSEGKNWLPYTVGLPVKIPNQVSLKFSVPNGGPPQYIDINYVRARPGLCT